jgi:hypothetical protein
MTTLTDMPNPHTAEMVGAAIEEAIDRQEPDVANRLRMLFFAGDWSLRPLGEHRYMVTIGDDELLEITAGGPFANLAALYQRSAD